MHVLRALLFSITLVAAPAMANYCASPGRDGDAAGMSGVVNTYWPGSADASSGNTSISLGAGTGTVPIQTGDLLLVIQMQAAQIDSANDNGYGDNASGDPANGVTALNASGVYEFVRAAANVSLSGGTLTLVGGNGSGLLNSYDNDDATTGNNGRGQRRFQVVRVPQYRSATLGANLTALAWNGRVGGVLAVDVAGTLTLSGGTASVSGLGFRGGGGRQLGGDNTSGSYRSPATDNANASKGEGIAGTPRYAYGGGLLVNTTVEGYPNGSNGRGAPGTAGGGGTDGNPDGNDENTGGGGGAGYGSGGKGGNAWCGNWQSGTCATTGGHGGAGVNMSVGRLLPGGGGGAGTSNNGTGSPGAGLGSSGGAGGGIIIIRAGTLTGSGSLRADGAAAPSPIVQDGAGGGGGGGSVLLSSLNSSASVTVSAAGGRGGDAGHSDHGAHGPGGGGGGGFIATSFGGGGSVGGGSNGSSINGAYGSVAGSSGSSSAITSSSVPGVSSGAECVPHVSKSFNAASIGQGGTSRLTVTIANRNPTHAISALAFNDAYPAGLLNTATPGLTNNCGGTGSAAANGVALTESGGALAANGTCSIAVNVTGTTLGAKTNTLAIGSVTATVGGSSVSSVTVASATLTVTAPLSAAKTATTISDPVNGTTNPKAIPGAIVEYTITISNPTGSALDNDTVVITDAIPANASLIVSDIGAAGSGPVAFTDGSPASGLGYAFASLGSTTDRLDFSNNNGAAWTFAPTAGSDGTNPNVTNLRVRMAGSQAAGTSFTLRFRVRIH